VSKDCKHCRNGWFDDQKFGTDVECVNGVLIDIDIATEGWHRDMIYPVAPCHPSWAKQEKDPDMETWENDCQERLEEWASRAGEVIES
jgi:hypothetical protein